MIDTKKAREMRASGTAGPWVYEGSDFGSVRNDQGFIICSSRTHEQEDELIAYAVNALVPMADEIDRLRDALAAQMRCGKECLDPGGYCGGSDCLGEK